MTRSVRASIWQCISPDAGKSGLRSTQPRKLLLVAASSLLLVRNFKPSTDVSSKSSLHVLRLHSTLKDSSGWMSMSERLMRTFRGSNTSSRAVLRKEHRFLTSSIRPGWRIGKDVEAMVRRKGLSCRIRTKTHKRMMASLAYIRDLRGRTGESSE